jgi:hypothetical protein
MRSAARYLSAWTTATYPFVGAANHLCMTSPSPISTAPAEKRARSWPVLVHTYVAVTGGAIYGSVYDLFGFAVVSLMATATLWLAALAVALLRSR